MAGFQIDSLADRVRTIEAEDTVPGLLFAVKSDRLKEHLVARSAYHAERAKEKQAEIPALEQTVQSLREAIDRVKGHKQTADVPKVSGKSMSNRGGYGFDADDQTNELASQIDALRSDIKEHLNKAATFRFLADSLFLKTYALDWNDLRLLELAK